MQTLKKPIVMDKYAVSSRQLEQNRVATLAELDCFLKGLGYL